MLRRDARSPMFWVFWLIGATLLAFIALKAIKNKSLRDGVQSVINLSLFSAGMVRGLMNSVRDPMKQPAVTVSNPKHIQTEHENIIR